MQMVINMYVKTHIPTDAALLVQGGRFSEGASVGWDEGMVPGLLDKIVHDPEHFSPIQPKLP